MADTKVSDMTNASTLSGTEETHVTQPAGTDRAASVNQIKTFVNTAPVFAAGTASPATWPVFTSGTLLTTPEEGAVELDGDCFYATTDAGNRGYIPVKHFIRSNATRTFTSNTSEQAIWNSPANGRLTLETGTYLFDGLLALTAMSATSGNLAFDLLGAGTAVVGDWLWQASGNEGAAGGAGAQQTGSYSVTQQSNANLLAAATQTTMGFALKGTFTVTTAGTVIPSITMVTASASIVSIGSFLTIERIGSTSVVSVGQWD